MKLTNKQGLTLRAKNLALSRELRLKDDEIPFHAMSWSDLCEARNKILKAAQANADAIGGAASDEAAEDFTVLHGAMIEMIDAIDTEKDIRSSLGNRSARDSDWNPRRPIADSRGGSAVDLPGNSFSENAFFRETGEARESFALRSNQSFESFVQERRDRGSPFESLSFGNYMRAMVLGPRTDEEKRALSEGTDSAGGYTVPDILSGRLIDRARAASVVMKAGAQTVPLLSDKTYVARVAGDPVPAWRLENAVIAESAPTFARVDFTARSLAVMCKVSRELLEDSLNIGTALPTLLATALAQELDRVALLGSGTAPEPKGIRNMSGLTSTTFAGGDLDSYIAFVRAKTALRTANHDVSAFILSPRDEGALAELVDVNGQPLMPPRAVDNIPFLTTSKIPTNEGSGTNESLFFAGDWRRLMIGIRSQIRIEILRERFADYNQYAFVAHLRADVAAEDETAFTVVDGLTVAA